jgi:hypothetical protein
LELAFLGVKAKIYVLKSWNIQHSTAVLYLQSLIQVWTKIAENGYIYHACHLKVWHLPKSQFSFFSPMEITLRIGHLLKSNQKLANHSKLTANWGQSKKMGKLAF